MATVPDRWDPPESYYPDSDGQPMSETPQYGKNMRWTIETLDAWFADDPRVYVAGNMFVYYERGDRLKHLSPDVFVVRGIDKFRKPERRRYLVWVEDKAPDLAIEFTSESTREEDLDDKFGLYRDTFKIGEYFLFDPLGEYLKPRLKGYRLQRGKYLPIRPVKGRLPSKVLGLHLDHDGGLLRLYDPATQQWLLTPPEERAGRREAEAARRESEAENERLRQELEALRQQISRRS